jgi:integrase
MARSVQDTKLDSRNARDRLKPRARPYYTTLIPGELHIGYRRRRKGKGAQGRWLVRRYMGKDAQGVGRYQEKDIGLADDFLDADADGRTILDFKQAQKLANEWRRDSDGGQAQPGGPFTVRDAMELYFAYLENEGRPTADTQLRANLHILPSLGKEQIDTLKTDRLRRWKADLAKLPARLRQKADATMPRYRPPTEDDETENKRRRKSTANRVLTILKAALYHAFDEGHAKSNRAWGRRLKPFKDVDAARQRFLTVEEAKRLVNASEPDLRNLVMAGLSTGARFGELARLKVADFNPDASTVAVLKSKSGKSRQIYLTDEGAAFFKQLAAGRAGGEVMLRKADGTAWQKSQYSRPVTAAVERAKISPPISIHALRHSYASLAIMNGTPLQVVARNLGHRDTRMVERHYGHMADSYLKDEIKKGAPVFGFKGGTVVALDKKGAAR